MLIFCGQSGPIFRNKCNIHCLTGPEFSTFVCASKFTFKRQNVIFEYLKEWGC